jgi:hypothetical protein
MTRICLAVTLAILSLAQATAQPASGFGAPVLPTQPSPTQAPAAADLRPGEIWVHIVNNYGTPRDSAGAAGGISLALLGLPSVTRRGYDEAVGTLTRRAPIVDARGIRTVVYQGEMDATAVGMFDAPGCSDGSQGTQKLWAIAEVREPARALSASDTLLTGTAGEFELVFYFLPNEAPEFTVGPGACQGMLRFEGYGGRGGNSAPYAWLPQQRDPGDFLPFNDTRWTTQNGLDVVAPPAGGHLSYWTVRHDQLDGATTLWRYDLVRAR